MAQRATREGLRARVDELASAAASRFRSQAAHERMTKDLAALARSAADDGEELDEACAVAAVRRLQRAQLEELRSLRSPPRIVREALGLVYALLRPSALVESVERVSWDVAVEALDHEWLAQRTAELSGTAGLPGVFLAVPCVRQVIDALEAAAGARQPTPQSARRAAPRAPQSARGAPSPRPAGCAGAAVAQLLSLHRQGSPGSTQRCGSIICGGDEVDVRDVGDVGLLAAFGGEAGFVLGDVASVSPAVGVLLFWALAQLNRIRMQWLSEAEAALVQKVLQLQEGLREQEAAGRAEAAEARPGEGGPDGVEVRFSRGSSLMSSLGARPLGGLVEAFRARPDVQLNVEGLVEAGEAPALGLARAQAVGRYLERQGVPARSLLLVGAGAPAAGGAACARVSAAGALLPPAALNFAACSDALAPDAAAALEPVATFLRAAPAVRLSVGGHTDRAPMWLGNAALAEGRAGRVLARLEQLGAPRGQLEATAYAERAPLQPEEGAAGCAANRRVELRVLQRETAEGLRATQRSETSLGQLVALAAGTAFPLSAALRCTAAEVLDSWGVPWGRQLAAAADPPTRH